MINFSGSSSELEELYKVLGLTSDASMREVKAAYRNLVMLYHPDHSHKISATIKKGFNEQFRQVNEAYNKIKEIDKMSSKKAHSRPRKATVEKEYFRSDPETLDEKLKRLDRWISKGYINENPAKEYIGKKESDYINTLKEITKKNHLTNSDWATLTSILDNDLSSKSLKIIRSILKKFNVWPYSLWKQISDNIFFYRVGTNHNKYLSDLIKTRGAVPQFLIERMEGFLKKDNIVLKEFKNASQNLRVAIVEYIISIKKKNISPIVIETLIEFLDSHIDSSLHFRATQIVDKFIELPPKIEEKIYDSMMKIFNNIDKIDSMSGPFPNNEIELIIKKKKDLPPYFWKKLHEELKVASQKKSIVLFDCVFRLAQKYQVPENISTIFFKNTNLQGIIWTDIDDFILPVPKSHTFKNFKCKSKSCIIKLASLVEGMYRDTWGDSKYRTNGSKLYKSDILNKDIFAQINNILNENMNFLDDNDFKSEIRNLLNRYYNQKVLIEESQLSRSMIKLFQEEEIETIHRRPIERPSKEPPKEPEKNKEKQINQTNESEIKMCMQSVLKKILVVGAGVSVAVYTINEISTPKDSSKSGIAPSKNTDKSIIKTKDSLSVYNDKKCEISLTSKNVEEKKIILDALLKNNETITIINKDNVKSEGQINHISGQDKNRILFLKNISYGTFLFNITSIKINKNCKRPK